jgi:hypothetical protein
MSTPAWLRSEVASGLQRLVALGLPGQPPAETIALTAATWCEALAGTPISWDAEQDAPRLRAAFAALLPQVERWPAPVALLRNLPPRVPAPTLPPPRINPARRADLRESLERLRIRLTAKP